eukprot:TRINITY_DN31149_c0_g1_i1.p1 TRINITY_DN31149_c0_g1~~TRINITY_DN31149_c0_g1_i1.p1  ORF type:complete len:601 (-),score=140.31 TRINITY_DN31149_c0_g1_i1:110-1912(-)
MARLGEQRWEVHPSPYGVPYYYNPSSGESRWTLPTGPNDVVLPPGATASTSGTGAAEEEAANAAAASKPAPADAAACGPGDVAEAKEDGKEKKTEAMPLRKRPRPEGVSSDSEASAASSSSSSSSSGSASSKRTKAARAELTALRGVSAALEGFGALLREKGVGRFDSYEMWRPRLAGDPRFLAVPLDLRQRLFLREAKRLGEARQRCDAKARARGRQAFEELLSSEEGSRLLLGDDDNAGVDSVLERLAGSALASDERWMAVAEPKERQSLVSAALRRARDRRRQEREAAVAAFQSAVKTWLSGLGRRSPSSASEVLAGDALAVPSWDEAKVALTGDRSFQALSAVDEAKRIYEELARAEEQRRLQAMRDAKRDRDAASNLRQRDEREEVEAAFRETLEQHVRCLAEVTWAEAKVLLAGVPDDAFSGLNEPGREGVFNEAKNEDIERRLAAFARFLRETPGELLGPEAPFERALETIVARASAAGDHHAFRGLSTQQLRRTWEDWRRARLQEAAESFQLWLRSLGELHEASGDEDARAGRGPIFEQLCQKLSSDLRYRRLDPVPSQRRRILSARLCEVASEQRAARLAGAAQKAACDDD